jgi:hypothetical protein
MFQHPDATMALANQRASELRAEADRQRRISHAMRRAVENERAPRKPVTLHPLVFWALR